MNTPDFNRCDRRQGSDRRQFSYSFHIPERRSSRDRRSLGDRRDIYGNKKENTNRERRCND